MIICYNNNRKLIEHLLKKKSWHIFLLRYKIGDYNLFKCKRKCKKGRKFVTSNEKDKISWPWMILFYLIITLYNNLLVQRRNLCPNRTPCLYTNSSQCILHTVFLNKTWSYPPAVVVFFSHHFPIGYRLKSKIFGILFKAFLCDSATFSLPS